jgi:hypothetical protein
MLKKFVFSQSRLSLTSKPAARISELKEYACLRESLNEEASKRAIEDFRGLADKYNLRPEELTQLFKIINEEPESLRDYVPRESWVQDVEQSRYLWRKSPFHGSYPDFQTAVADLRRRYPDVANYDSRHPERVKGYQALENIFIRDGPQIKHPADAVAVTRFLPEFAKRINGHINELRHNAPQTTVDPSTPHASAVSGGETDAVQEIARVLTTVYRNLEKDPAFVYGKIRHFLAFHRGQLGEIKPRQAAQIETTQSLEEKSVQRAGTRGDVAEQIGLIDDAALLVEEQNKELRRGVSYNFLPWINERKLIFEAQADRANPIIYQVLGGLFGAYFLYKLYRGDATNTALVGSLAVSAFLFGRARVSAARNQLDYLVQMNIHRDGRNVDLFIQRANNQISKIEGVPISDFKLHKGDYEFQVQETELSRLVAENNLGKPGLKLSDMRRIGAGRGSWVATYGQDLVFVPMDYQGNSAILNSVFKGRDVESIH